MLKQLDYIYGDNNSSILSLVHPESFVKTAEYSPELFNFIDGLEAKEGLTYALVNALSAGEYYGCFFKGQQILTIDGYKSIEEILLNDLVWTHDNTFKSVINTFVKKYEGLQTSIKVQNFAEEQKSTESHPYLVLKQEFVNVIKKKYYKQKISREIFLQKLSEIEPTWINARDIKPGDYIYSPIKPIFEKEIEQLPIEYAYLFGYYLSEGCLAKRYDRGVNDDWQSIIFSFGKSDQIMIDKLSEIINTFGHSLSVYDSLTSNEGLRGQVGWKEMAEILFKYFGHHSKRKFIHPDIFAQTDEWILTFLAAYLDGDGCIVNSSSNDRYLNTIKASTVSRNLAFSIQRLFARVGIVSCVSLGSNLHKNGCFGYEDNIIYEISIGSNYTKLLVDKALRLTLTKVIKKGSTAGGFYILPNGFILAKVKAVTLSEIDSTNIYNIEVSENNSYVVDFIAHNSNRNGDYFPEDSLIRQHDTFTKMGYVYQHHINKDPKIAYGRPIFSSYNPEMHRVELIIEIDNTKARPFIDAMNRGDLPKVSMACKVPNDVCSICGNKAKTRMEYCDHLRSQMSKVLPDGRKVYAINFEPRFFDISFVTIPADRTAGVITKIIVDSNKKSMPIGMMAKDGETLEKAAALESTASMKKEIGVELAAVASDPKRLIVESQKRLTQEQIEKLSTYPMEEVLSTLLALRIMPIKEDFQKLALYSAGYKFEADKLETSGYVFEANPKVYVELPDSIDIRNFNEKIATEILGGDIALMANTKPLIVSRVLDKQAMFNEGVQNPYVNPARTEYSGKQVEPNLFSRIFFGKKEQPVMSPMRNPAVALGALGAMYVGYARLQNAPNPGQFKTFLLSYPWLAPIFLAAAGGAFALNMQKQHYVNSPIFVNPLTKRAGLDKYIRNTIIAVPPSYYFSYKAEEKARRGIPISGIEDFVRRHPLITSYAAGIGATKLLSKFASVSTVSSLISRLDDNSLDALFHQLIEEE